MCIVVMFKCDFTVVSYQCFTDFFCVIVSLFCAGLQLSRSPENHTRAMSRDKKRAATLREGYDSDTSYDPVGERLVHPRAEPHDTRLKAKPHASALLQSEPNSDTMAMIRVLMEEQRRAESERAEAWQVAEIEREEARGQEVLRREEARGQEEFRREAIRVERETAKRVEELERERTLRAESEVVAAEAARRQLEQQEALPAKQFEQQVALMRVQAELGEEAARLHREEQSSNRKRDRTIASIPNFRDGEDVEEFLLTAERRLRAGGIKEGEWIQARRQGKCKGVHMHPPFEKLMVIIVVGS